MASNRPTRNKRAEKQHKQSVSEVEEKENSSGSDFEDELKNQKVKIPSNDDDDFSHKVIVRKSRTGSRRDYQKTNKEKMSSGTAGDNQSFGCSAQCGFCGTVLPNIDLLDKHIQSKHQDLDDIIYKSIPRDGRRGGKPGKSHSLKCKHCPYETLEDTFLQEHIKTNHGTEGSFTEVLVPIESEQECGSIDKSDAHTTTMKEGDGDNLAKWGNIKDWKDSNDFGELKTQKTALQKRLLKYTRATILNQCIFNMIDPDEVAKKYDLGELGRKSIESWAQEAGRQLPTFRQFQLFKDAKTILGHPLDKFMRCEKCMDPFEQLDLAVLMEHIKTCHITTSMII